MPLAEVNKKIGDYLINAARQEKAGTFVEGLKAKSKIEEPDLTAVTHELLDAVAGVLARGERAALVTIVRASGSTPQRVGAKMLVLEDGRLVGTIGGGCYENDALGRHGWSWSAGAAVRAATISTTTSPKRTA